jgi:hypothetical protein
MSTPFLDGILSLALADEEVSLIPAGITFLTSLSTAKTGLQRALAVGQLEQSVLAAQANIGPTLLSQVVPSLNTAMTAILTKAQATVATGAPPA